MLTASFRHITGIGGLRERQLWAAGISRWEALPAQGDLLSPRLDARLRLGVADSVAHLEAGDVSHFARLFPHALHWRLLPHVLGGAAFLDIEVGAKADEVTVVGVLDGQGVRSFVRGRDLDELPARAAGWSALVTFNGLAFDEPILRRAFPGWEPPAVHIDLRLAYARLREKGGLKQLEARLGFHRPPHLSRLSGADAVALWHAEREGDPAALRRLVEYNLYDAFILKPLAELAYNRLSKRCGMPVPQLPVTERGALLYDVSCAVERACAPAGFDNFR